MVGLDEARAPDGMRIYAIGDVHGCLDHLAAMHDRIGEEIERDHPADWRVIHVGDYVDRGPDSSGVIDFLARAVAAEPRIVALRGNHDQGMLDFLRTAEWNGIFANNGGETTGRSYGLDLRFLPETAQAESAALSRAMPLSHHDFLEGLPLTVELGDYFFCHAGVRPGVALEKQSPHDLMWIRRPFVDHDALFVKIVVHGHTPVREAQLRPNRINIDTGACITGRLTAIALEGGAKRLLSVEGPTG